MRYAKQAAIGYLDPFPRIDYSSAEYRASVNGSATIDTYFQVHDRQQPGYLGIELLSRVVFRGLGSGGVLQDSVGENFSFENKNDLVMPVESSPTSAG